MPQYFQNSFTGGEIDEGVMGRSDLDIYFKSAKQIDNFIVRPYGGLSTRCGFKNFGDFGENVSGTPRIFKYVYSNDVSFVVGLYYNSIEDRAELKIFNSDGSVIEHGDITFDPDEDLPYTSDMFFDLKTSQFGNSLYFVDGRNIITNAKPHKLVYDGSDFTFSVVDFTLESASTYLDITGNTGSRTEIKGIGSYGGSHVARYYLTCYNTKTGKETLPYNIQFWNTAPNPDVWQDFIEIKSLDELDETDYVQIVIRTEAIYENNFDAFKLYRSINNGFIGFIAEFLKEDVFVEGTNYSIFNDVGLTSSNNITVPKDFEDFDNTNVGYPTTIGFIQNRSVWANVASNPLKLWLSNVQQFENLSYTFPLTDTRGIQYTLASDKKDGVEYIIEAGKGILFTSGSVNRFGASGDGVITYRNLTSKRQTNFGCSKIKPLLIGGRVLYITNTYKELRDIAYNFQTDSLEGYDFSFYVPHLMRNSLFVEMDYQHYPYRVLWMILEDGSLYGMTYSLDQKVFAWHKHPSQCDFVSLVSIPQNKKDVVYTVMKEPNSSNKYIVGKLMPDIFETNDLLESIYLDSYKEFDGETAYKDLEYSAGGTDFSIGDTVTFADEPTGTVSSYIGANYVNSRIEFDGIVIRVDGVSGIEIDGTVISNNTGTNNAIYTGTGFKHYLNTFPEDLIEGNTYSVISENNYVGDYTIPEGFTNTTIKDFYSKFVYGYKYTSTLKTNDLTIPNQNIMFNYKNIISLDIKTELSSVFKIGEYENNLKYDYWGVAPSLSTDEGNLKNMKINTGWSKNSNVTITREAPFPLNISCINFNFSLGGK